MIIIVQRFQPFETEKKPGDFGNGKAATSSAEGERELLEGPGGISPGKLF